MTLAIFEVQPGLFYRPTELSDEPYSYLGYDPISGLHMFEQNGKRELFAKRKHGHAGWHLKRGAFCYEFCRSQ